mgnify:CR=1 FL=1
MPTSARKRVLYSTAKPQQHNGTIEQEIHAAARIHDVFCFHLGGGNKLPEADTRTGTTDGIARVSFPVPLGTPRELGRLVNQALDRQIQQWGNSFDVVHLDGTSPAVRAVDLQGKLKAIPKLLSLDTDPVAAPAGPPSAAAGDNPELVKMKHWIQSAGITYFLPATPGLKRLLLDKYGVHAEKTRVWPLDTGVNANASNWLADLYTETLATCGKLPEGRPYRQCTKCVLDTLDDAAIQFDDDGVCTYCHWYHRNDPRAMFEGKDKQKELEQLVDRIKKSRHGKYDCIAGVSGGADSSYVALKLKELGLTPLLVHVDNGYNSEVSNKNVAELVKHLGFDLHSHVIEWEEFRDIQLAFFRASVMDIELVTDHAMVAYLHNLAAKLGIKYVISGHNFATEGILPNGWNHEKMDLLNIRHIAKEFSGRNLKTLPRLGYWRRPYLYLVKGIRGVSLLNYLDYDNAKAKQEIIAKLGWTDYGAKHTESVFTRFYQNYILPTRFHIDKRKAHLSTMIASGLMDRPTALAELQKDIYTPEGLRADLEFVINKLGITEEEFNGFMTAPIRQHTEFPSYVTTHYPREKAFFERVRPLTRLIKGRKANA